MHIGYLTAAIAGGAAIIAGAYAMLIEQFSLRVREFDLSFPNLPPAFDGCTILHLSDLHLAKLGLLERRLMDLVSRREVDICVVTGDITQDPRASDIFRRISSKIKRRDPIHAVLGNSEHKPWLDTPMLVEALSFDGLNLLVNSSDVIRAGEESIAIVGVDDAFNGHADVDAAFRGVDPSGFIIFLTHCPSLAPDGIERGADLVLSGHTHGGQVRLPFIGPLWTHMRRNRNLNDGLYTARAGLAGAGVSGFERSGNPETHVHLRSGNPETTQASANSSGNPETTQASANSSDNPETRPRAKAPFLFVNRGVGTSKLHIRFLCPPEIAYITLRRS